MGGQETSDSSAPVSGRGMWEGWMACLAVACALGFERKMPRKSSGSLLDFYEDNQPGSQCQQVVAEDGPTSQAGRALPCSWSGAGVGGPWSCITPLPSIPAHRHLLPVMSSLLLCLGHGWWDHYKDLLRTLCPAMVLCWWANKPDTFSQWSSSALTLCRTWPKGRADRQLYEPIARGS